jgi:hypothetical protein
MAAAIPGAQFVLLEGKNHLLLPEDPGFNRFFDETKRVLSSQVEP